MIGEKLTTSKTTTSANTFNKNFEIVILFNVVERSGNYVSEYDICPIEALTARVVGYTLGAYNILMKSVLIAAPQTTHLIENKEDK